MSQNPKPATFLQGTLSLLPISPKSTLYPYQYPIFHHLGPHQLCQPFQVLPKLKLESKYKSTQLLSRTFKLHIRLF